ncbi:MAG: UDP-N-acetylmuramate--L-alanine ligase [Candidatus Pacebacteria bacterium]|nr:UDP-N-acetylmuramate--L-alanine ligase [Candidatus Paceibacterota bacterium]
MKEAKKIYFIGIGGIGMSALAQYYLAKGAEVFGSDLAESEITKMLEKKGAKIIIISKSHLKSQSFVKRSDLVIYSKAVPEDHPELKLAKKFKIECLSYPEALGELTKKYFTIAVCGIHGKSTTTAMISLILIKAGLNPTVILGTKLKEFGNSNFRMGGLFKFSKSQMVNCQIVNSQILVIEADEHFGSFLNYWPKIIVLTNIEKEHLDYYKSLKNLLKAFAEFISHLPEGGFLIINKDDKNITQLKISPPFYNPPPRFTGGRKRVGGINVLFFSLKEKESRRLRKILKVPGKHNLYNAFAALTCARALKIPDKISFKALSEYRGAWRRMEEKRVKVQDKEVVLISDYGHHPTEIRATIEGVKEKYPKKQTWLIFQPHQYQRTYYLFDDFVKTLVNLPIEKIIIPPIFDVAGREEAKIRNKVSSEKLVLAVNKRAKKEKAIFIPNFEMIKSFVESYFKGDILIIMGAGDVYNLVDEFST